MGTAAPFQVEAVIFGYFDARIPMHAPFGFALKVGDNVTVHHRTDILNSNLPRVFGFTAKNLHNVIVAEAKGIGEEGLYDYLCRKVFCDTGSFRCWNPIVDNVSGEDFDGFVSAVRGLIDIEMERYAKELKDYETSCSPGWRRSPDIQKEVVMPTLQAVMA